MLHAEKVDFREVEHEPTIVGYVGVYETFRPGAVHRILVAQPLGAARVLIGPQIKLW